MDSSSWQQKFGSSPDGQTRTSFTTSSSSFNSGGGSSSFEGFPSFQSLSQVARPSFSAESYSTDSSKTFYLASVSNGHVLAHQEDSHPTGVVVENKGDRGDEQKWTVECGDESNTIALKCVANGKYLHCFEGKSWGKVGTGDKQWWKISDDNVTAPGACRIGPVDYPDVFLNHHSGNTVQKGKRGTKVHMYKWEQNNERHTSWYFTNTSSNFHPAASNSSSSGASKADFDSKLKALEDREATLTQRDKDRSAEWEEKMKDIQERQDTLAQEEKDRAASYEEKLKDLRSREAELAKKEEQQKSSEDQPSETDKPSQDDDKAQADKEADIQRKLDDLKSAEQKIAADRASLGKSKADFTAKLEWFQQRQKSFEDQKLSAQHDAVQAKKDLEQRVKEVQSKKPPVDKRAAQSQDAPKAGQNTSDKSKDADLQKKQRENADLEKRLAKLEDQLAQMNASGAKSEKPQANGTGKTGLLGCGYKHYKPPRKINRKVTGLVYE